MTCILGKLADHVRDHVVLSPEGVVLVTSSGTGSSYPRPPQSLKHSVVQFKSVLPEAAPCDAYAPVDLDGQVGIVVDVALWLTSPPRHTNSFVWVYTWPAASTLNEAVDSSIPFARKHMISVLASDTVMPNAALASY